MDFENIPLSVSPLLANPTIVRDYTSGEIGIDKKETAETKIEEKQATEVVDRVETPNSTPPPPPTQPIEEPKEIDDLYGKGEDFDTMDFDDRAEYPSDSEQVTEEPTEEPKVKVANSTAKSFAETIVNLFDSYVVPTAHNFIKIDMNSVGVSVASGDIAPEFKPALEDCNKTSLDALRFKDDEKSLLTNSLKEFIKYKGFSAATPETAFYGTLATVLVAKGMEFTRLKSAHEAIISNVIIRTQGEKVRNESQKIVEKKINKKNKNNEVFIDNKEEEKNISNKEINSNKTTM